jgi:hypothetical protein
MTYQSWDDVAARCRWYLELIWMRPMFANAFIAALENIKLLRQEFDFDMLRPGLSHETITLTPFPGKPPILIFSEKPGAPRQFGISTRDGFSDGQIVAQDQLISTVYDYLERLIRL